jgi:hypothetical protein
MTVRQRRTVGSAGNRHVLCALPYQMDKLVYTVRLGNIFFLSRIGQTLKWATQDVAREELPPKIQRLLAQLERAERAVRMSVPAKTSLSTRKRCAAALLAGRTLFSVQFRTASDCPRRAKGIIIPSLAAQRQSG